MATRSRNRWVAIAVIVAVTGGGVYAAFSLAAGGGPAAVSLSAGAEASCDTAGTVAVADGSAATGDMDGTWSLAVGDSFVGYRVREQLAILPAPNEAVGRTAAVAGELAISGLQITTVDIIADLTQLTSDRTQRDERIHTIGLETDAFPQATFTLSEPITFDAQPANGEEVSAGAVGDLTLHGVTKQVCVPVQATLTADAIQVVGSVDIVFADYGMEAPNFGFVSTEDNGTIEFELDFAGS